MNKKGSIGVALIGFERSAREVLSLSFYPELKAEEVGVVVGIIRKFFKKL